MKKFEEYLNRRRLEITKPYIKGSVLDIGCGPATTYTSLKIENYSGIERNLDSVKKLKEKFPLAKFYVKDIEKERLNFNKKFDTIVLLAVIEHIGNTKILYKEIKKSLKMKGKLVMTTPTPFGNFIHTILSFIGLTSKHAAKEHVNICSRMKFIGIAKKYGFKIIKYKQFELWCNSLIVLEKI